MKRLGLAAVLLLAVPQTAGAVVTFQQLDGNTFTVSHAVKWIGSRGQAMQLVYEKAASLCIAAGYTHMRILDQASNASGYNQSANATLTVKFFVETGEDRVDCKPKATEEYIEQARKKLEKKGYTGPIAVANDSDESEEENQCTVEQIAAMVKAGLSDEQIKAACGKDGD